MVKSGDPVKEEEVFFRRYYLPLKKNIMPDGTAHSRVFKAKAKDKGRLSVDASSMTTYEKAVVDEQKFFLVQILNSEVIKVKNVHGAFLQSVHNPTPNEETPDIDNPAHCLVFEVNEDDDITPKLLADKAKAVERPTTRGNEVTEDQA